MFVIKDAARFGMCTFAAMLLLCYCSSNEKVRAQELLPESELLYELDHLEGRYDVARFWFSTDAVRPPLEWLPVKIFHFGGVTQAKRICRMVESGPRNSELFFKLYAAQPSSKVKELIEAIQEVSLDKPESISTTCVLAAIVFSASTESELRDSLLLLTLQLCLERNLAPTVSNPVGKLLSMQESDPEQAAFVALIRLAMLLDSEEYDPHQLVNIIRTLKRFPFRTPFIVPEGSRDRRRAMVFELRDREGRYTGVLSDYEINEGFRRNLLQSMPRHFRQKLFQHVSAALIDMQYNSRFSLEDYELLFARALQCDSYEEAKHVSLLLAALGQLRDVFVFSDNKTLWHKYLVEQSIEDLLVRDTGVAKNWIGGSFFLSAHETFRMKEQIGKEIESHIRRTSNP